MILEEIYHPNIQRIIHDYNLNLRKLDRQGYSEDTDQIKHYHKANAEQTGKVLALSEKEHQKNSKLLERTAMMNENINCRKSIIIYPYSFSSF